jgi:hypothetical protein
MPDEVAPQFPPIAHANYDDAARAAIVHPDESAHPGIFLEATKLDPLRRIQSRLNQVAAVLADYARPGPKSLPGDVRQFIRAERDYIARDVNSLAAAHAAAIHLYDHYSEQFATWEKAMDKKDEKARAEMAKKDPTNAGGTPVEGDHPQLTTSGAPHPLEAGGYEANEDPQLPGNISDVEALKEGKTTRQQATAIAEGDAAAAEEKAADDKGRASKGGKGGK